MLPSDCALFTSVTVCLNTKRTGTCRIGYDEVGYLRIKRDTLGFQSVFSERELMFMFAIGRRPSVCLSSVVCLSVVCL